MGWVGRPVICQRSGWAVVIRRRIITKVRQSYLQHALFVFLLGALLLIACAPPEPTTTPIS